MIPRYLISCRVDLVLGAFFLLGFAAGFSSSLDCIVASKYVIFLFCFVVSFCVFFCWLSGVFVDDTVTEASTSGRCATLPGSGVIAAVASLGIFIGVFIGVSTAFLVLVVGANVNFVCCGPGELISFSLSTRVCFVLRPPLGEASFLTVLVGFRFALLRLVMVAHVASGTLEDVAARAGHYKFCRS